MKNLVFTRFGKNDLPELKLFIRRNQKFAVALCSRFEEVENDDGGLFSTALKHFYVMRTKDKVLDKGRIHGFFYAKKDVLMLHLFDKNFLAKLEADEELALQFREKIRNILPSVYGVAGVSLATTLIAQSIGLKNPASNYYLMEFSPERPLRLCLPKDFSVKKCTLSDLPFLFELQKNYEISDVLPAGHNFESALCRKNLQNALSLDMLFAISHNGQFVAKANVNASSEDCCQIGGVCTLDNFRRRGLATFLTNEIASRASSMGKSVVLFVRQDNFPAIHAYENAGFKQFSELQVIYR